MEGKEISSPRCVAEVTRFVNLIIAGKNEINSKIKQIEEKKRKEKIEKMK